MAVQAKSLPRRALAYLLSQERSWKISDSLASEIAEASAEPGLVAEKPVSLLFTGLFCNPRVSSALIFTSKFCEIIQHHLWVAGCHVMLRQTDHPTRRIPTASYPTYNLALFPQARPDPCFLVPVLLRSTHSPSLSFYIGSRNPPGTRGISPPTYGSRTEILPHSITSSSISLRKKKLEIGECYFFSKTLAPCVLSELNIRSLSSREVLVKSGRL